MTCFSLIIVALACFGSASSDRHSHKHHHKHHHKHTSDAKGALPWVLAHKDATTAPADAAAGPVSNVAGVDEVYAVAKNASDAFQSAKQAATSANDIAVHSLKISAKAREGLEDARTALRDARSESEGLSWDQREFLRQAEGKLREATQEAEFGKLKQAKYVYPDDHGTRYTVGKESYLRSLEHQLAKTTGSSDGFGDVEGAKGEEARLKRELFTLRQQLEAKMHDAKKRGIKYKLPGVSPDSLDDQSADDMMKDIENLEKLLAKLESAPKSGESSDEVKVEIERLRASIHRLEVRALTEPELVEHQLKGLTELKSVLKEIKVVEKKLGESQDAKFKAHLQKDLDGLNAAAKVLEEDLGIQPAEVDALLYRLGQEVGELKVTMPDAPPTPPPTMPSLSYEIPEKRRIIGRIRELAMRQDGSHTASAHHNVQHFQDESAESTETSEGGAHSGVSSGIDIDTAMPYGELEPFGREDTAQELTEASIHESDGMVDQIERAEVSEEKRAVFRALTRLRGAAITSFDGVARSQTGNIDEYNKVHQWRNTHPLHHLADEESDISKWAFPEDADF